MSGGGSSVRSLQAPAFLIWSEFSAKGSESPLQRRPSPVRALWHTSRKSNVAPTSCPSLLRGFLSGRLSRPVSASDSGYMFGKGVYFADMASKSAQYCFCTPANNTGAPLIG